MELGHYIICLQGRFFGFGLLGFFFKAKPFLYSQLEEHCSFQTDTTKWRGGSSFLQEPCKQGSTHLICFACSNSKRFYLEFCRKHGAPQVCLFISKDEKSTFSSQDVQNQPNEEAEITQAAAHSAPGHCGWVPFDSSSGNNSRFQSFGTPHCLQGSAWEERKLQIELLDIFLASVVLFQLGHSFWRLNFPLRDADLHQCNFLQSWQKLNFAAPAPWHGSHRVFFAGLLEGQALTASTSAAPENTQSKWALMWKTGMLRDFTQCVFSDPPLSRVVRF